VSVAGAVAPDNRARLPYQCRVAGFWIPTLETQDLLPIADEEY